MADLTYRWNREYSRAGGRPSCRGARTFSGELDTGSPQKKD